MKNIAVVISVSDYGGPPNDLQACSKDGAAMNEIIEASKRYADVLYIKDDTASATVKSQLAEFVKRYHGQEVDEVFFYFTGHGDFIGNELYYLLSDYDPKHRQKTSLGNSEVDQMIRALQPKLFVKVVDACYSGKTYIKSRDEIDEYLKSANASFKKLYFLFSSQSDQTSGASQTISYFTESILRSIYNHKSESIRYADIMADVSDDFASDTTQTPLFVTQADFTEVFVPVSGEVKSIIGRYIVVDQPEEAPGETDDDSKQVVSPSIAERIKEDAKTYCSRAEAMAIIDALPKQFKAGFLPEDITDIYKMEVSTNKRTPTDTAGIGRWLDTNAGAAGYFATPIKAEEAYKKKVTSPLVTSLALIRGLDDKFTYVDAVRTVATGFKCTTELPYQILTVELTSELPNVSMERCYIVPILSRTHIRLFWAYVHYRYDDWDSQTLASSFNWSTGEAPLKDANKIATICSDILDGFAFFVEEPLRARWGVSHNG